jgi:hypothetical protein
MGIKPHDSYRDGQSLSQSAGGMTPTGLLFGLIQKLILNNLRSADFNIFNMAYLCIRVIGPGESEFFFLIKQPTAS